jgi:hypothetical protein
MVAVTKAAGWATGEIYPMQRRLISGAKARILQPKQRKDRIDPLRDASPDRLRLKIRNLGRSCSVISIFGLAFGATVDTRGYSRDLRLADGLRQDLLTDRP